MSKIVIISLFFLVLLSTSRFGESVNPNDPYKLEKQILDHILDKNTYDSRIRPINTNGTTGAVILNINMFLRQIEYICTKKQEWKTQLTFRHEWNDPRLKFDNKNGQIRYLALEDIARLWIPDTFFTNSISTQTHTDLKPNTLIRIYPNGNVLFSIRLSVTLSCPMELKYYPFDTQRCYIQLASYGYTSDEVSLKWKDNDPVQITKIGNLPDFGKPLKYETGDCSSRTNTGEYSCIKVNFTFKRYKSKYICQWLIPTAFLTFLSFASFWMKPKKSSRVKFLATILVLLYLYNIYVNNKSSANAGYSTAKDCWMSTCLWFVLSAFIEYGILTIIDKNNKQNMKEFKATGNGKGDPEGDGVALKPLVEGMNNIEESRQYTVNETSSHNLIQKWRRAPTSSRIDIISSILFPLLFILYIIIFTIYQILDQ